MGAVDERIAAVLDELVPPRPNPDGWTAIMAVATRRRERQRNWWLARGVPVAVAGAAVLTLVLAWPFGGGPSGSVLERAAAAIGDGPVLHVVIQDGWGGTLINLKSGARTALHGEEEIWYDPSRGIHDVSRFDGVVQGDAVYPPGRVAYLDKTLTILATGYREALRNGTARLLGPDTVDGQPVYWIRVDTQMLPDSADNKLHAWVHDVAVSQKTFEPVATRDTRDGQTGPDGNSIILKVETLPVGAGNFARETPDHSGEAMKEEQAGTITPVEASAALGRPALWAGKSIGDLDLARIEKTSVSEGYDKTTGTWAQTHTTVTLFYGTLNSDESPPGIGVPAPSAPYVEIAESPTLFFGFQRGVSNYTPPEGSLLVVGGRIGIMQADNVHLALEASTEELMVAAARALQPIGP
jgi:hypothetical protein